MVKLCQVQKIVLNTSPIHVLLERLPGLGLERRTSRNGHQQYGDAFLHQFLSINLGADLCCHDKNS